METHTSPCLQSNVFTFVQSSERVFRRKVCIIGTHTGSEPVKRGPRVYPGQITWSGETPGSTYSNPMIIKLRQCFMLLWHHRSCHRNRIPLVKWLPVHPFQTHWFDWGMSFLVIVLLWSPPQPPLYTLRFKGAWKNLSRWKRFLKEPLWKVFEEPICKGSNVLWRERIHFEPF